MMMKYRHLAISLLALLLPALKSVSQPCSRPRHLVVGSITLQLLILSLIMRYIPQHTTHTAKGTANGRVNVPKLIEI